MEFEQQSLLFDGIYFSRIIIVFITFDIVWCVVVLHSTGCLSSTMDR